MYFVGLSSNNNTQQQNQNQTGSKFAAAMAAMRDVKRRDKEEIAIERINAVNEAESGDLELKKKDLEMGVFRTRGYANTTGGTVGGVQMNNIQQQQQQEQQQVEIIPVVNVYNPQEQQPQHQETDEEKLERLTKLVSEEKLKRRKARAMRQVSSAELDEYKQVYLDAQRTRRQEILQHQQRR